MDDWSIGFRALSTNESLEAARVRSENAMMFVYLHGFNSSPGSFKATALAERLRARGLAERLRVPALPHWPQEAVAAAEAVLPQCHDKSAVTFIGSSLGGHYATWLAERHAARAVLVNPAIRPDLLMAAHLGPQINPYTGERYTLTSEHVAQLRALEVARITRPERYLLVVASGDEVLDSRVALRKFAAAEQIVDPGGDHGFAEFVRYLDAVIDFGLR